jgi:4-amino-4-deoxy-L-arabinose transferase-like glycosyltransferase
VTLGKGKRRQAAIVPLGLVLLAFALRLYRIDAPALRGDEAFSILLARNTPREMLGTFVSSTEPHPPLSFLVLHYWGKVAGESEFALRLTSAMAGVAVVPLIFVLGRRLWNRHVGLVAAGLLALNPFYIWHAQEARMYAWLAALTLASTLLCMTVLTRRAWYWSAAYGLVTALSVYTHYYAFLVIVFQGVYAILHCVVWSAAAPARERIRSALWWGMGLTLAGVLYLPWFLSSWQILSAYHGSARSDLPLFEPVYRCLLVFGQGQTLPRGFSLWFLPLWGGLLVGGVVVAWTVSRPKSVTMLLYLLIPWGIIFVDSLQRPAFDERYFMVSTPPYYVFVALGLVALYNWRRVAGGIAGALIVGVCALSLRNHYHDPAYARAPDWRALNEHYVQHTRAGDVVVVNYPDPAASYYYCFDVPWVVLPESFPVDQGATIASLKRLVEAHPRVWLTPQQWAFWDDQGLVERWLTEQTERVSQTKVDRFTVQLYHTPRQFRQELVPVDVRLEHGIQLVGYVLRDEAGGAVDRLGAQPGQQVRLTLYWQAGSSIPEDYVVFVHVLDETGWLRGQQDNQPRQGTFPTRAWIPGELVVDAYHIPIAADAPPGQYSIEVGMYRPGDGMRLAVAGADADVGQRRMLLRDSLSVE